MPLVCDVCRTSNLDSAMFCDQCASALRGLAPTGISAFELSKGPRVDGWPISDRMPLPPPEPSKTGQGAGFRMRIGLVMLATAVVSAAGFVYLQIT